MPLTSRAPVPFIVGASRSGTSLLRAMLNAHPDLAIPPESHFIPELVKVCSLADDPMACFCDHVQLSRNWTQFSIDDEVLLQRLQAIDPFDIGAAIRNVFEIYAEQRGKPRWGDKTPMYAAHMPLVQRLIPETKFIHIIRDGRDVCLSALPLMQRVNPSATLEDAARYWVHRVTDTRKKSSTIHEYLEVRFEDLVQHTESQLRRLCEFIELPWNPILLRYYAIESDMNRARDRATTSRDSPNAPRTKQPPDITRISRWRNDLPADELPRIEAIAGSLLEELGYSLAGKSTSDQTAPFKPG